MTANDIAAGTPRVAGGYGAATARYTRRIMIESPTLVSNTLPERGSTLCSDDLEFFGREGLGQVERYLQEHPHHRPTPLHALPETAAELGIESLYIKDEGPRLGLGSFKALGGAYAVIRVVLEAAERHLGRAVALADWRDPAVARAAADLTVASATDGNHGRSVAYGAQLVGARCVIFVHAGVSAARRDAIRRYGATIVEVAGDYDTSVAVARTRAENSGWQLLSDTAWPGYERIPRMVMQGYLAIAGEALRELPQPPTHVFLQAGVGGFAAALAAHMTIVLGSRVPRIVVVEPARAACLYASVLAGHAVKIPEGPATIMGMLECREPSSVAWRILARTAAAFMTVEEAAAVEAMTRLAYPRAADPRIVAGESGGAGFAGLVAAARNLPLRAELRLDSTARVLLVNTEGATDPGLYRDITGAEP